MSPRHIFHISSRRDDAKMNSVLEVVARFSNIGWESCLTHTVKTHKSIINIMGWGDVQSYGRG